jgi:hypothetical protein
VLTRELNLHAPLDHCGVPAIAAALAIASGRSFGIEYVPGPCEPADAPRERFFVEGLSIGQLLDRATALDPRYRWVEVDGVILVRPAAAWQNDAHFLHGIIERFVHDGLTPEAAYKLVRGSFGARAFTQRHIGPDPSRDGTFGVRLERPAPLLEVLTEIARSHGHLLWAIEYCGAEATPEASRLTFDTLVPGGPVPREGRVVLTNGGIIGRNPCRP